MTLPKPLSPQRSTSGVYELGTADAPADHYDPESDVVAPLSMRASHTELLWVCGDCGHHYPRSRGCPDGCSACGAPREHFYAPVED
jgi:rubrerythrin